MDFIHLFLVIRTKADSMGFSCNYLKTVILKQGIRSSLKSSSDIDSAICLMPVKQSHYCNEPLESL